MMPTSPSPSLKFRTVGFPQYGFKASRSDTACRFSAPVKPMPGIPGALPRLRVPFAGVGRHNPLALSPDSLARPPAAVREGIPLSPRGPWLRAEFCCLRPSSLTTTPSASLAGTRRLHGIAAYTPRLRCAGTPRRPTRPSPLFTAALSARAIDHTPVGPRNLSRCPAVHGTRLPRVVTESPPTTTVSASNI